MDKETSAIIKKNYLDSYFFFNFKNKELVRIQKFSYIDKFIYKYISINVVRHLNNFNITPNMVTTVSFIFGLIASINLYFSCYKLSGICFISNYLIDCVDGPLARYTKKISRFGDLYDHITDILTYFLLLYSAYYKQFSLFFFYPIAILSLTTFFNTAYISNDGILVYSKKFIPSILIKNYFQQFDTALLNFYIGFYLILTGIYF